MLCKKLELCKYNCLHPPVSPINKVRYEKILTHIQLFLYVNIFISAVNF